MEKMSQPHQPHPPAGGENAPVDNQKVEELFLLHLRYKEASLVETGANKPLVLNHPHTCWVVYRGWVDVFAVPLANGQPAGSRTHLFRVQPGRAIFGLVLTPADEMGVMMVGGKQTSLLKINLTRLHTLALDEEFRQPAVALIDHWVRQLSESVLNTLPPKECVRVEPGQPWTIEAQGSVCAKQGVLWVQHTAGHSHFAGNASLPYLNGQGRWPISERSWIQAAEASQLDLLSTAELVAQEPVWGNLQRFHQQILHSIAQWRTQALAQDQSWLKNKVVAQEKEIDHALRHLLTPLQHPAAAATLPLAGSTLLLACQLVGQQLGIPIQPPPTSTHNMADIARASQCQTRRVVLSGAWWTQDNGPLVGFWGEDEAAIALLYEKNSYWLVRPGTPGRKKITPEVAGQIQPFAYMFYRPFPSRSLSLWDILRFALTGKRPELQTIFGTALLVTLLGLLLPMATGFMIDQLLPRHDVGQLWQLGGVLVVAIGSVALFQVLQNLTILRLQGRMGAEVQAATWDRLLKLPTSFFRDYSAGDLGTRVMGITVIQELLSGSVLAAVLSGLFSMLTLFLLLSYDTTLALTAMGLVLVAVLVSQTAGYFQVRYQRQLINLQGDLSGLVLQTIQGLVKFRAAGAESRAFANWSQKFSQYKQLHYQARQVGNTLIVFQAGYQILTLLVLFVMVFLSQQSLTTGQFLGFNAAFAQFFASVLAFSSTVIVLGNVVPFYERAQPILQAKPEVDELKEHPGELQGRIEVAQVNFQYHPDTPLILKNVSLEINPGEFVALVGPSGSGKSTLFRMLLGFEQPAAGAVYYDQHDLKNLDVREVRRQLGVVLQNGQIMAGDIFTNIIGSSNLTLDDAWRAAEMAGLADDIRAMPMQMHTIVSEGGKTLSGGQRQRLLIARAIVNRPRILFFDEATSALDNHTQEIVSRSLEGLQATRVVIAHRLSTIVKADRIYVLENGRVVQQGNYAQLIKEEGLFAELAKRQIA